MTAEVAILNRSAVAIAADSAVTIGPAKTYPTVEKIIPLPEPHNVAMMIYGSVSFMNYPWDTLIRLYADAIPEPLPRLPEYQHMLVKVLRERLDDIGDTKNEDDYVSRLVLGYGVLLERKMDSAVMERFDQEQRSLTDEEIAVVHDSVVERDIEMRDTWEYSAGTTSEQRKRFLKRYEKEIRQVILERFGDLPGDPERIDRIFEVMTGWFLREMPLPNDSGVVIAGYGVEDIFPAVTCTEFSFYVGGMMKHQHSEKGHIITNESSAAIIPFAQDEMVHLFIEGVDRKYATTAEETIAALPKALSAAVAKALDEESVHEKLEDALTELVKERLEMLQQIRAKEHREPIVDMTDQLPPIELARMAESLVRLTTFKRKITPDAETVAEPIDVAILSKREGFRWVQRKTQGL